MSATPRYSTRADLPPLVEIGRDAVLTCPVHARGELVAASSAVVSIYDARGAVVVDAADATPVDGVASYTLAAAATADAEPSGSWRIVWTVTLPGGGPPFAYRSTLYVVRFRLYPTIADDDIGKRVPSLALAFRGRPTVVDSYADAIEEADTIVQRRLLEGGRRPWLICEPWALREAWLCYAIAVVFDGLVAGAADGEPYSARAAEGRKLGDDAFSTAQSTIDYDEDGTADGEDRAALGRSGVWLC